MSRSLGHLEQEIADCRFCIDSPLDKPLPHAPLPVVRLSSTAKLCIAGQAPGLRVHQSGIPFDDPSGDRLRQWMGIDREQFYDTSRIAIVPMGFCFPGYDEKNSDLPPRKECRLQWHDRVFEQMPQLELVLVVGRYAQAYHLGQLRKKTLTETVMNWREIYNAQTAPRVLPLPHPSWRNSGWLKRNLWFEEELLPEMREEIFRLTVE